MVQESAWVTGAVWVTEFVVLDFGTGANGCYVWCIKRSPPKVGNIFIIMAASEILLIKMGKIFMFLKQTENLHLVISTCHSTLKPVKLMIKVGGISAYWFTGGIIVESDQTNVFCLF